MRQARVILQGLMKEVDDLKRVMPPCQCCGCYHLHLSEHELKMVRWITSPGYLTDGRPFTLVPITEIDEHGGLSWFSICKDYQRIRGYTDEYCLVLKEEGSYE